MASDEKEGHVGLKAMKSFIDYIITPSISLHFAGERFRLTFLVTRKKCCHKIFLVYKINNIFSDLHWCFLVSVLIFDCADCTNLRLKYAD